MLSLNAGQVFDSNYELKRLIDTGGFADVWEAKYLVAGNTVALKVYPRLDEEGINNIEAEYKKLFELQHSHLVNALHFGKFNGYPYLVMRFYSGGNAAKKIGSCSEQEIARCILHISSALKYLHANDFIHQDIKPNNFLIDQQGNYYLGDLGLSHKVINTIKMQTQTQGNRDISSMHTGLTPPPYRAPELYNRQRESTEPVKATDIWALGASAYEMITGNLPFGDLGGLMQMNDPVIKDLPEQYSPELNNIIKECLQKESLDRPTAAKLENLATQYINNGKWLAEETNGQRKDIRNKNIHSEPFTKEKSRKKLKIRPFIFSVSAVLIVAIVFFLYKNVFIEEKKFVSSPKRDTPVVKTDSLAVKPVITNNSKASTLKSTQPDIKKIKRSKTAESQKSDKPTVDREQNMGIVPKKN